MRKLKRRAEMMQQHEKGESSYEAPMRIVEDHELFELMGVKPTVVN